MPSRQPLLNHLANIFREYDTLILAGGSRALSAILAAFMVSVFLVTRGSHESMTFAKIGSHTKTNDLPEIIVAECLQQKPRGASSNERVEVCHHPVLPDPCSRVVVEVLRVADYLALVVNGLGKTHREPSQGSEIHHDAPAIGKPLMTSRRWRTASFVNWRPAITPPF